MYTPQLSTVMTDLYVAMAGQLILSAIVGLIVARMLHRSRSPIRNLTAAGFVAILISNIFWWREARWWALIFPSTALPVLSNVLPVLLGAIAGCSWVQLSTAKPRRWVVLPLVLALTAISAITPLTGHPPECGDEWQDGVCIQSGPDTCGPAAAATLLSSYNIPASEAEMAELCLTRRLGTTWMGAYRGLKIKTARTGYQVCAQPLTHKELLSMQGPVWLRVEIKPGEDVPEIYTEEWGWTPGQPHAVVYYGRRGMDRIRIGDPSIGAEEWSLEDLEHLWHGEALWLTSS